MRRVLAAFQRTLPAWLAAGVCISVGVVTWLGFHAVVGWQRSATRLADERAQQTADLLVTAISRDMRGAQSLVLSSPSWDLFMLDRPFDLITVVAGAFARFPYPESFFAWRGNPDPSAIAFFDRANRRPPWAPAAAEPARFPVLIRQDPALAEQLATRIKRDADRGARFSLFETSIAGVPYQVVVRLLYQDVFREHLAGAFGFTVNLPWVRAHYFSQLTDEVSHIAAVGASTLLRIADQDGVTVFGPTPGPPVDIVSRRTFPLKFYDPWVAADTTSDDAPRVSWTIVVGVTSDSVVGAGFRGAHRSLLFGGLAAVALALGLVQTARATRAQARLTEMRTEFVSAVTHELKTPLSTIHAIGETVARGRVRSPSDLREYAQLVVQESRRLTRLVDNLLAYSRVVDVANIYSFEPVSAAELLEQVRREFDPLLESRGFEIDLSVPETLPPLRGDRTALGLLVGNIIDNAIRHSRDGRWLGIAAHWQVNRVAIEISDRGIGIPPDEIPQVTSRFVRGRGASPGGSGLGLAIATRIAQDHGGSLEIRSTVGFGTTVTIAIPTEGALP
jgi:signal transduction histidine kinase